MKQVTLHWYEVSMAAHVGNMRRTEQIKTGNFRPTYAPNHDEWTTDQDAACAELALAKLLHTYWAGTVNSFKLPDVDAVQVRHTSLAAGCLIVRSNDNDDDLFVLVTGRAPDFNVVGCILGREAKQEQWLRNPNGVNPAWFVPQSALREIPGDEVQRDAA